MGAHGMFFLFLNDDAICLIPGSRVAVIVGKRRGAVDGFGHLPEFTIASAEVNDTSFFWCIRDCPKSRL